MTSKIPYTTEALPVRWSKSSSFIQHLFEPEHINAINVALAIGAPLLLKGEPGTGKSQLALAAATALNMPLLSHVVNARLEANDLLYDYDAVARLSEAQYRSHTTTRQNEKEGAPCATNRESCLAIEAFIRPSELWWAINPEDAEKKAKRFHRVGEGESLRTSLIPGLCDATPWFSKKGGQSEEGKKRCVVLIDEIDKAPQDVPNSLLEIFSLGSFKGFSGRVDVPQANADEYEKPLVIITTNEDRELPPAFVRRCLVLDMSLPKDEGKLKTFLRKRVEARPQSTGEREIYALEELVLEKVLSQLIDDRDRLNKLDLPRPGQAEFLSFVSYLEQIPPSEQMEAFESTQQFIFNKYSPQKHV